MTGSASVTNPYDPLLTLDEAGDLLGTGPGLPRRLVTEGRLDHVQDGDDVRVLQSALIAYVIADATERDAIPATSTHHDAA
jgi:excisionase family DNA binding protein